MNASAHATTVADLSVSAGWQLNRTVTVRVPASSANLGPGFDSIGLGLGVWDEASASLDPDGSGVQVEHSGLGAEGVPLNDSHLVVVAMRTTWRALGQEPDAGLRLSYLGAIPHSRGMGSSASAIVAGVALATVLAGYDLDDDATRAFVNDVAGAMEGHPDNTSASVFGRATISWFDAQAWRTCVVTPHQSIIPMVLVPDFRLDTAVARAALPEHVALGVAAANSARAALLAHALTSEPQLLMDATVDYLHQEPRRQAYPDSMALVDALRAAGIPATISGAGPTVLAFAHAGTQQDVSAIAERQPDAWQVLAPGVAERGVYLVSS